MPHASELKRIANPTFYPKNSGMSDRLCGSITIGILEGIEQKDNLIVQECWLALVTAVLGCARCPFLSKMPRQASLDFACSGPVIILDGQNQVVHGQGPDNYIIGHVLNGGATVYAGKDVDLAGALRTAPCHARVFTKPS